MITSSRDSKGLEGYAILKVLAIDLADVSKSDGDNFDWGLLVNGDVSEKGIRFFGVSHGINGVCLRSHYPRTYFRGFRELEDKSCW